MIEYLRGTVRARDEGHVVLDVGGVGYGVDCPASLPIPPVGEALELHVYLHVNESAMRLFGFRDAREKQLFETLLGAQGIGPRTALGMMSAMDSTTFARAILQGDLKTLTGLPGIGKKTAERLAVDLRDKMAAFAVGGGGGGGEAARVAVAAGPGQGPEPRPGALPPPEVLKDAIDAMLNLGTKPAVAERAVVKAAEMLGAAATAPQLVKEALKHRA